MPVPARSLTRCVPACPALILPLALAACARHVVAPPPVSSPAPAVAFPDRGGATASEADFLRARALMVPVAGVSPERVSDSYDAPRGARTHQALDILAPRGTPVLSVDAGRILKMHTSSTGGITIYAADEAERFIYYYAHLERYRAGLAEGMKIAKGDILGFVGTTGNAPKDTPHLHFQAMRMGADRKWSGGAPVDPRPFFTLRGIPNDHHVP